MPTGTTSAFFTRRAGRRWAPGSQKNTTRLSNAQASRFTTGLSSGSRVVAIFVRPDVVIILSGHRYPKHQESLTRFRLAPARCRHYPFFAACAECHAISRSAVRSEASGMPWTAHGQEPGHGGLSGVHQSAAGPQPKRRHAGIPVRTR